MGCSAFLKSSGMGVLLIFAIQAANAEDAQQATMETKTQLAAATVDDFDELPAGYHRMPDGTVMANSPSTAVAPPGFHLMPDGTLMANGSDMSLAGTNKTHGGMWMTDYQSQQMYMGGMLDTTTKVSGEDVLAPGSIYTDSRGYTMSPTDMTMDMHMFMFMYHSSRVMAMLMLHYMNNEMGMINAAGQTSTMKSSGMGDTVATLEFPIKSLHAKYSVGVSIPTGSITEHGPMAGMGDVRYPYGMQLGSGTYDILLGAGVEKRQRKLTYAANYQYVARTGENSEGYTLGNKYSVEGLLRYHFSSTINSDFNISFTEVDHISGRDQELLCSETGCMSPAADYQNTGGRRGDFRVGVKYENSRMSSFAFDYTQPFYQNLTGPQMRTDWIASFKFGYMF